MNSCRKTLACLRARLAADIAVMLLIVPVVASAAPPRGVPVVTQHDALIAGAKVSYSAEAGRIAISDVETGAPHGYMFYTAYRAIPRDAPLRRRPIMFVWGGGPGAPSTWLHFHIAGPKLLAGTRLIDNPDSWLATADLVLVDPIGTGFSRPARPEYAREFYNTRGDVASVAEFVRCWLILHDEEGAPVFLVGESWGAGRAASVAYALEKRGIGVNGLVLISGGFGLDRSYGSPTLLRALGVVDMASTALYWLRSDPSLGSDATAVRRSAEIWVRRRYAPALDRIDHLSDAERTQIAERLARFTGIPAALIDRRTLVITPHQFRTELLASRGEVLYLLDGRRISPPDETGAPEVLRYLRETLGYRTDLPYLGIEDLTQGFAPSGTYPKSVNEMWDYATAPITPAQLKAAIAAASASGGGPPQLGPPLPGTREALELNPHLEVLVVAGMYDPYEQCARGRETENSLPPKLRHAIIFKCYAGGHAMYLDSPSIRAQLSHDIAALVASARPER